MQTAINHELAALAEACRQGALLPLNFSQDEKALNRQLHAQVKEQLPVFDLRYMDLCEKAYSEGFDAAIVGKLDISEKAFAAAENILATKPLYHECRLLTKAFLRAAQSFLDYTQKKFDQARLKLEEAIQCDEILESQYGYKLLHIHRVHLVENIMRNEMRAQRPNEAFCLAASLLRYLAGVGETLPIAGQWGQNFLAEVTGDTVRAKFAGIAGDVAQYLAGKSGLAARQAYAQAVPELPQGECRYAMPEVMDWFKLKGQFCEGQSPEFLASATAFLKQGPRSVPVLWCATAFDAVMLCEELGSEADQTAREILTEAMKWPFISRSLKPMFFNKAEKAQLVASAGG